MLIPQFSLRSIFGVMTASAGIFTIVAYGVRGQAWAAGLSIALGALVLAMLTYATLFAGIWAVAAAVPSLRRGKQGQSPFQRQRPPGGPPPADPGEEPATPILLE